VSPVPPTSDHLFAGDGSVRQLPFLPAASTAFSYQAVVLDVDTDWAFLLLRTGPDRHDQKGRSA
jgi:hypothetical protein